MNTYQAKRMPVEEMPYGGVFGHGSNIYVKGSAKREKVVYGGEHEQLIEAIPVASSFPAIWISQDTEVSFYTETVAEYVSQHVQHALRMRNMTFLDVTPAWLMSVKQIETIERESLEEIEKFERENGAKLQAIPYESESQQLATAIRKEIGQLSKEIQRLREIVTGNHTV